MISLRWNSANVDFIEVGFYFSEFRLELFCPGCAAPVLFAKNHALH